MPQRQDLEDVAQAHAQAAGYGHLKNQTAIDMLQPGDVLVVDLFGKKEDGTIVGDNLFYYIMKTTKTVESWWMAPFAIWKAFKKWTCRSITGMRIQVTSTTLR